MMEGVYVVKLVGEEREGDHYNHRVGRNQEWVRERGKKKSNNPVRVKMIILFKLLILLI